MKTETLPLRLIAFILIMAILFGSCTKSNPVLKFDTVENTINSFESLDYRITGSKANYYFAEELKLFLEKLANEKAELSVQKYTINIPKKCEFVFTYENDSIVLNNDNCIVKSINTGKMDASEAILVNSLVDIKKNEDYVLVTNNIRDINYAESYSNIIACLHIDDRDNINNIVGINNNTPTSIIIDRSASEKLIKYMNKNIFIGFNVMFEDVILENIYVTYKGKTGKESVVLTAHYDSIGSDNGVFSKGVLDNGSGVSAVLNILQKTLEGKPDVDRDIIFAFVNSEEQLDKGLEGSKRLAQHLDKEYDNVININIDCIGEMTEDTLYFGMSGSISNDFIIENIKEAFGDSFILEKVDYYPSDHLNFQNALFFYNFNLEDGNIIHTDKDNKTNISTKKIERIADKLRVLTYEISNIESKDLFETKSIDKCELERMRYDKALNFGQYVFFPCFTDNEKIHYFIKGDYGIELADLDEISDNFLNCLSDESSQYYVVLTFELPEIKYNGQQIETVYQYFQQTTSLNSLISQYPINGFTISSTDLTTYEIKYTIGVQKIDLLYYGVVEYFRNSFKEMRDLSIVKNNDLDIYIGYDRDIKSIKSIFEDEKYSYIFDFKIHRSDDIDMLTDDLIKLFATSIEDIMKEIFY